MTRNEMITEKMWWDSDSQGLHVLETWDEQPEYNKLYLVKLLQQRMVDDDWEIEIAISKNGVVATATALLPDRAVTEEHHKFVCTEPLMIQGEPQAIFELFCRVYGIPASE